MPIYKETYRNWYGRLKENPLTWWVIGKTGIRLVMRKSKALMILLFIASSIPFFVKAVQIYLVSRVGESSQIMQGLGGLKINTDFFAGFLQGQMFFAILVIILTGAGLIAQERKYKALSVYFSKPVTFWDYVGGKFLVISFYGSLVTLLPGLILFFIKALLSNDLTFLKTYYWIPLSMLAYVIVIITALGGLILALSSAAKGTGSAAVVFIVILMFPDILSKILSRIPEIGIFSIQSSLKQTGAFFFGIELPYDFAVHWGIVMLVGVVVLSYILLQRKIKPTEVIK
ncbi:MAG: ABC transporter permease subunit [bacterium]